MVTQSRAWKGWAGGWGVGEGAGGELVKENASLVQKLHQNASWVMGQTPLVVGDASLV